LPLELDDERVAGSRALSPENVGERPALTLVSHVANDAEEIARVDAVGERPGAPLGFVDGDAIDDRVERIARDGRHGVPPWVIECEADKCGRDPLADDGILMSGERLAGLALSLEEL